MHLWRNRTIFLSILTLLATSTYPVSAEESLEVEVVDEDCVADPVDDHADRLGEVGQLQQRLDRLGVRHHVYVLQIKFGE